MYHFQHQVNRIGEAIRPEVFSCFFVHLARLEDTRIRLFGDTYTRIAFAVLQEDIVVRLIAFDEVVLQEKSVLLAGSGEILDVRNVFDQLLRLVALVFFVEITVNTPFQVLGLTHIDNYSVSVEILVHSGSIRQTFEDAHYVVVGVHQK